MCNVCVLGKYMFTLSASCEFTFVCACCVHGLCHSEQYVCMLSSWCMSHLTWCIYVVFMVYVTVNWVCEWCAYGVCHSEHGV